MQVLIKKDKNESYKERGKNVKELLMEYKYPVIGGLIGLVLAILFFTVGFFKTILVVIMIGLGVFVGNYMNRNDFIGKFFSK